MPSEVHEAGLSHMAEQITTTFREIFGSGGNSLAVKVNSNVSLRAYTIHTIPDLLVDIRYASKLPTMCPIERICIWECAFSQSKAEVKRKLEHQIASYPKLISVARIMIKESPVYSSPNELAITGMNRRSIVRTLTDFMVRKKDSKTLGPVRRHGFNWINITSVEMHMWVRTDDEPINVRRESTAKQIFARGV